MNDFDLEKSINKLDEAINHVARQAAPAISEMQEAKDLGLKTLDEIAGHEITVAITLGELLAIEEACDAYRRSMIRLLEENRQREEYELRRQAYSEESGEKRGPSAKKSSGISVRRSMWGSAYVSGKSVNTAKTSG